MTYWKQDGPIPRITATTALLFKDADMLTVGQEPLITTLQNIEVVLKQLHYQWLSNVCMGHYPSPSFPNLPCIWFLPSGALNPTFLLHNLDLDASLHDCVEYWVRYMDWEKIYKTSLWRMLTELSWYIDRSHFINDGKNYMGDPVVTMEDTVWVTAFPSGTYAQRTELVALTMHWEWQRQRGYHTL